MTIKQFIDSGSVGDDLREVLSKYDENMILALDHLDRLYVIEPTPENITKLQAQEEATYWTGKCIGSIDINYFNGSSSSSLMVDVETYWTEDGEQIDPVIKTIIPEPWYQGGIPQIDLSPLPTEMLQEEPDT